MARPRAHLADVVPWIADGIVPPTRDTNGHPLIRLQTLGAAVVRTVTQVQTFESAGVPMPLRLLIPTEVGNWIGWTLWALLLTSAIRRYVQPARSPMTGVASGFITSAP